VWLTQDNCHQSQRQGQDVVIDVGNVIMGRVIRINTKQVCACVCAAVHVCVHAPVNLENLPTRCLNGFALSYL
jgi:hypothetical protein